MSDELTGFFIIAGYITIVWLIVLGLFRILPWLKIPHTTHVSHRWSGWPGAWCLDCGIEDPLELCINTHGVLEQCIEGHPLCTTHAMNFCLEHSAGSCKEPGSRRCDPYK